MRHRLLNFLSLIGEIGVVIAACAWMTYSTIATWLMTICTICFSIGRLVGKEGDYSKSMDFSHQSIALRRLYRQRIASIFFLCLTVILMYLNTGFYVFGVYIHSSNWIIPFIVFTIFETYTAFRIPTEEKKNN